MTQQHQPSSDVGTHDGRGCFSVAVVCLFACVLVVSSVFCGFGSYLVAALFGSKSIGSSIAGAVAAIAMISINFPGGVAVWFCLSPGEGKVRDGFRASVGIGMAAMTLLIHGASVVFVSIIAAIPAAYLFWRFEPAVAAVIGAVVFPVVGAVSGAALCQPNDNN